MIKCKFCGRLTNNKAFCNQYHQRKFQSIMGSYNFQQGRKKTELIERMKKEGYLV